MWLLTEINSVISVWDKSLRESLGTENLLPRENNKKTRTIFLQRKEILLQSHCKSKMNPLNLVWMLSLMMQHIHQKGMKRFVIHLMRFSGESRVTPRSFENDLRELEKETDLEFWKWLERTRKGDWLGVFTVVDSISIPAYGLNFTLVANEECLGLPRCEIKQDTQR